jgi:hypothetical protein
VCKGLIEGIHRYVTLFINSVTYRPPPPHIKKIYLNILGGVRIVVVDAENNKDVFDKYTKERDKYNAHYSDLSKAGKKTASQEKKWIDWPDYLKLVTKMKGDIKNLKGKGWSWREKQRYQDYLIVLR